MTKYIMIISLAVFCGMIIGMFIGVMRMNERASDGTCIRGDDGEVYLRISEIGQRKLADPKTKLLYLIVIDANTRNKHSL